MREMENVVTIPPISKTSASGSKSMIVVSEKYKLNRHVYTYVFLNTKKTAKKGLQTESDVNQYYLINHYI